MPCMQCENGKWRWGSGPCTYDSKEECEQANEGQHSDDSADQDEPTED